MTSCPTSKIEWDIAARKKNCSRIASQQNCAPVEKFKFHCVINGYKNETLEVCAPSRVIFGVSIYTFATLIYSIYSLFINYMFFLQSINFFTNLVSFNVKFVRFLGHCVEFNLLGGVIQDQWSSPCKKTFPKCDVIYNSTAAYKCNLTVYIMFN